MKIVIVGHVDHGKSTLVGRLFYETDSLPEGKFDQIKATCERRGVPFEWAFLMDALQAERDQNITIDTAQIWFKTEKRPYVIIDAPGHREFIKNMVTGAANADAALLLIAANEGVQEQSRRHGYLLSLLGVQKVAVVVNKMDMVDYSQEVFDKIETEYRHFLAQLGVEPTSFIPISAREGDNIAERSEETGWYDGPTIIQALDGFEEPRQSDARALRFPIQDIYRFDHRRILAGRVETGTIKVGDELLFTPGQRTARVKSIERWSSPEANEAHAGESVGITLDEQIFVERGHIAARADGAPLQTNRLKANLFWLGDNPIEEGKTYKLKLASQETPCRIESIERVIDASTLDTYSEGEGSKKVDKNNAAELVIRTLQPLALDVYGDFVSTARFVLVDEWDVRGGGIVTDGLEASEDAYDLGGAAWAAPSPVERFKRNRHRGCIIALHGAPELERKLLPRLERALFNRGMQTFTLEPRHIDLKEAEYDPQTQALVARNLAAAGVICLLDTPIAEGSSLRTFRMIADDARTSFIVAHLSEGDRILARTGKRASETDEEMFGDADILVDIAGARDQEEQVAAIVEKLIPYLQRF